MGIWGRSLDLAIVGEPQRLKDREDKEEEREIYRISMWGVLGARK